MCAWTKPLRNGLLMKVSRDALRFCAAWKAPLPGIPFRDKLPQTQALITFSAIWLPGSNVRNAISFFKREIKDEAKELAFRLQRFRQDRTRLIIVYVLTVVFVGINIANDVYFATKLNLTFVFGIRIGHMLMSAGMLGLVLTTRKPAVLDLSALVWIIFTMIFTAMVISTRPPDYYHSMMIDMVIIIMLFIYVPQPFVRQVFSGLIYTVTILAVYEVYKDLTPAVRLQSYLTLAVVNILGTVFAYQWHLNSRELFLSLNKEKKLSRDLQNAVDRLKRLNKKRARIYSLVAHDLRSPLNAIKGFSSILMEERASMSHEASELVEHVSSGANSLNRLLEDLLLWTMSDSDKLEPEVTTIQLADFVKHVVKYSREFAHYKDVEVQIAIDDNLFVEADPRMLESIMRNLLNNALKYSFRSKVIIEANQSTEGIKIGIIDHGVGLSADQILRIKQNFNQHGESTLGTLGEKGSGLGLQMVNDFLLLHHTQLDIESEQGKGTTMSFVLPAVETRDTSKASKSRDIDLEHVL